MLFCARSNVGNAVSHRATCLPAAPPRQNTWNFTKREYSDSKHLYSRRDGKSDRGDSPMGHNELEAIARQRSFGLRGSQNNYQTPRSALAIGVPSRPAPVCYGSPHGCPQSGSTEVGARILMRAFDLDMRVAGLPQDYA